MGSGEYQSHRNSLQYETDTDHNKPLNITVLLAITFLWVSVNELQQQNRRWRCYVMICGVLMICGDMWMWSYVNVFLLCVIVRVSRWQQQWGQNNITFDRGLCGSVVTAADPGTHVSQSRHGYESSPMSFDLSPIFLKLFSLFNKAKKNMKGVIEVNGFRARQFSKVEEQLEDLCG